MTFLNRDKTNTAEITTLPHEEVSKLQFIKQTVVFGAKKLVDEQLTQVASSLAYTTILAAVPLLTVILGLFTAFPIFNEFKEYLDDFMAHNLMPETISENILSYLNSFAQSASEMTAIGVAFLVITSIMLMMTIENVLNKIWRVKYARPLAHRILMYWAVLTLGPIVFSASLWAGAVIAKPQLHQYFSLSRSVIAVLIPWVLSILSLTLLYLIVPNRMVRWRDAFAGGFIAATLFEIVKGGFAFYINNFPSYTLIYGAFAAVPLFLLWIYISWLVVLFGAVIASLAPQIRMGHFISNYKSGLMLLLSANILRLLHKNRDLLHPNIDTYQFAKELKTSLSTLHRALTNLQQLGYIAKVEDENNSSWVLSVNDECDLQPLFSCFLFGGQLEDIKHDQLLIEAIAKTLNSNNKVVLKDLM